jgi:hypothetical protein
MVLNLDERVEISNRPIFYELFDGVSLLAFDENMRIIHLERRNDMGQWAFFSE